MSGFLEDARGAYAWLRRGAQLFSRRDVVELTSPLILLEKFSRYALGRHERTIPADDPDARDPEYVRFMLDFFRAVGRVYFRLEVRGVENVPAEGSVLLVGNHNGAFFPADAFFAAVALLDRYGVSRVPYGLAHDFLFYDERLRRTMLKLGIVRAGHDGARRVFAHGGVVLVFPGSDLEVFRPWRDRGRIVLGGRKGFLRLALRERVPIVPVVSAGTHEQLIVLTRGDRLAKLLHAHRWMRADVFPIVLSLPWGITSGFLPYLPLPAQTTIAFGKPISWPQLDPDDADDEVTLARCYDEVVTRMQAMLDELSEGRRPFIGQRPRVDRAARGRHAT